jgi:predicted alpha/beta superfamily hydrolase
MDGTRSAKEEGRLHLHRRVESRFFSTKRDLIVYVPPGYESGETRYPVLYLQDGQNLFDPATAFAGNDWHADATADQLILRGAVEPLILVGIYNAGARRISEYAPTRDRRTRKGGKAENYASMLAREIKPFIDRHYRTRKGAADTGTGGSSLGGLVSLTTGLRYPGVFGKLAVMSPSVWWDGRVILRMVESWQGTSRPKIWLDTGTEEGNSPGQAVEDVRSLRTALVDKGWQEGEDLQYHEFQGAGHNEYAWAGRFGCVLEYLFPRRGES